MTPAERLERAMWDLFWIPPESTVIDRPELLAFATPGLDAHYNAVVRTRAPAGRLPALIDEVDALHAVGAASRWQVTDTTDPRELETALTAAGYALTFEHDARVIEVDRFEPRPDPGLTIRRVVDRQTLEDSYDVTDAAFGPGSRRVDADRELAMFTAPDTRAPFFVAYDGDEPIAAGGLNLFSDLNLAMLWGGSTVPAARGRGAYSALVAARMAEARRLGIGLVGLYARVKSSSPIAAAQGFERHGSMRYWQRG